MREHLIEMLSDRKAGKRLKAAKLISRAEGPQQGQGGTLSIHTDYSFSPFTPALSAYLARRNGLAFAGISDHDTLAGAEEFCRAADIFGLQPCVGVQLRARIYANAGIRLNDMYENDVAFVSVRGLPRSRIKALDKALSKVRSERVARDRKMVERLNARFKKFGICLNFEDDVLKRTRYKEGGSVTERHILYALAIKLVGMFGDAERLENFLTGTLGMTVDDDTRMKLDFASPYLAHDLVGLLKDEVKFFYVPATDALSAEEAVALAHENGALVTYNYVGKRSASTGDEEFEGDNTKAIIERLGGLGFDAIEIVPGGDEERENELFALAKEAGMFVLPYRDVNSPRVDVAVKGSSKDAVLERNMWAVVGNGKSADLDIKGGIKTANFGGGSVDLDARLELFAAIGKLENRK